MAALRLDQAPLDEPAHHPSCTENDKDLVWHCNQCGLNESAAALEEKYDALAASIMDLSHPNCRQLLIDKQGF
jgi:hypothetical protein